MIVAVVFLIRRTWRKSSNLQLPASNFQPSVSNLYLLNWLLIGAVLFIVFITPVAKKYDRYMLPALPLLILVAAWGLGQIPDVIKSSRVLPRPLSVGLGIIVLSIQALIILDGWPYLMLSYNGLLGGAAEAQNHFAVGWGEGMGAAGGWRHQDALALLDRIVRGRLVAAEAELGVWAANAVDDDLEW